MLKLRKVAVTGGLSCGKSSVCGYFKELGAQVVSADEIVHQLLTPATELGKQIIAWLGNEVLVNGEIDRAVVAKIVFHDPAKLQQLQRLIHPLVFCEIEKQYQQSLKQGTTPLFIAEIPLLFEAHGEKHFDATVAVWADVKTCKTRFKAATGYSDEEFERRMANQMPTDEKAKKADYIIDNTGSPEQTRQAVADLFDILLSKHTN